MVKIGLQLRARLENVTNLSPNGVDFRWYLKLKCSKCREVPDHFQYITLEESFEIKGSRGSAHLVEKCRLCGTQNNLQIIDRSVVSYAAADSERFKTIVIFDCRGIEPIEFEPRAGWSCDAEHSDLNWPEISLVQREWCDYDDKAKESVGIWEVESKFIVVK